MAFELGKFQTAQQRRNAEQIAQADASGMQDSSLRGQQDTAPLSMLGIGGQPLTNKPGRAEKPIMPTDPASKRIQQGIFDKAFENYRSGQGTEPLVTPAERARKSEMTRMAQQYGGNEMRLAIMDQAPGKTPEDLVKYYQAQTSAGGDPTLKQKMVQHFATQPGFTDHQLGGEKAASMFVEQNPDIAFREFNKNVPLEVIGDGSNAQIRVQGNEGAVQGEAAGIDMGVDMNKAAVQREINERVAFEPLTQARGAQSVKTDTGTGVSGMQPGSAAVPAEFQGQLASNLDWKANKEVAKLGLTLGTFDTSDPAFDFVRKAVESIKGNKGFSYDQ